MACLVLVYELILKDVKVHTGDKLLQAELVARNMGSVVKSQCTLTRLLVTTGHLMTMIL